MTGALDVPGEGELASMLEIRRIEGELPPDFLELRRAARSEGWRHLERLHAEWVSGAFPEGGGLMLLGGSVEGRLVAVGALTLEPTAPGACRLRRFYVAPEHRRRGVGRALASALVREGLARHAIVTVHAGDDHASAFWESLGFEPCEGRAWSHWRNG